MKLLMTFYYPRENLWMVIRSGSFDDIRERYDNPLFVGSKSECEAFRAAQK